MTPLRMVGLIVLVCVVSLPMAFRLESSTNSLEKLEGEGNEDALVDLYCLKALEAESDGNYNRAIAHYNKAIDRDPKYAFAYIGRGDAHRVRRSGRHSPVGNGGSTPKRRAAAPRVWRCSGPRGMPSAA